MTNWTEDSRLGRSAKALKAYFEKKLQTEMQLLTEPPPKAAEGDVQFSLEMSQFGLWGLRSTRPLASGDLDEISATFNTVLGGLERMARKEEDLARLEAKLQANLEEVPSNVIPISRTLSRKPGFSSVNDKRWILRLDCLIEARYISEVHKMAMELHSQSARYAFVEYRDLDKSVRMSLPELLQLGAITLFIPDITELTLSEQQVLKELTERDTLNRPLLMVGALVPYADLRSEPKVDLDFLAILSRAYIKLTRPFAEYKEQGLIHYFLDSLS